MNLKKYFQWKKIFAIAVAIVAYQAVAFFTIVNFTNIEQIYNSASKEEIYYYIGGYILGYTGGAFCFGLLGLIFWMIANKIQKFRKGKFTSKLNESKDPNTTETLLVFCAHGIIILTAWVFRFITICIAFFMLLAMIVLPFQITDF